MEEITTSLDKIVAKYNDSITHSAPTKLNFENLSDSFNYSVPKKRRFVNSLDDSKLNGSVDDINTSLNGSSTPKEPPSPWETRRLKADLIESKTRISRLNKEIERQNKVRAETETLYGIKVKELQKQCEFSSNKILDLEKHMQTLRKREQNSKLEVNKIQTELNNQKHEFEEKLRVTQKKLFESEENGRMTKTTLENELGEYKRYYDRLQMEFEYTSESLDKTKEQLEVYKKKASAYDELKMQYEKDQQNLLEANSRVKKLENEIAGYNDWKEITQTAQSRLSSIEDMTKELHRLRANNKNLQDLLGNKLLLEEQVHDLQVRLAQKENSSSEVVALQVKLNHMEQEIKEWVKIAQDHCLPNTLVSPMALRSRIEQLLQHDIIMVAENTSKSSSTKSMQEELKNYKRQNEVYAKNIEVLNIALKRHKDFKEKIQKKLLLVSKERDCYKQLLDNFEKDLTISNSNSHQEQSISDNQLRARLEMLEKTLMGYKDMCAALEKELNTNKNSQGDANPDLQNIELITQFGYENFKKEIDNLRLENEKLRRKKEEYELELEHRCLKGDFNINQFKVVHFTNNPAAEAYANTNNFLEKLQAENERLKRRIKQLEEGCEVTSVKETDTPEYTMNIKELNNLRAELESANQKMKKMKECYKSATLEFRDVCYLLFGYRIDRVVTNTNYKLSSMFAENEDDYLNFRLNESNTLDMLENPYSLKLKPLIESHLVGPNSLPVFLSALTLELFQRSTVTMQ